MRFYATRVATTLVVLLVLTSSRVTAQRVLEWPLRTSAQPEAVVRGVEAAFWNPAAVMAASGRGEAMIVDQRTPDAIGISGFAGAVAWRLDARTTVAAGYQHVAIDDIGQTSTSPITDISGSQTFGIGEDQVTGAVSHILSAGVRAGAGFRFDRSNETGIDSSTTSLNAGFLLSPALTLRPVVGVAIQTAGGGGVRYMGGVQLSAPRLAEALDVAAGYGIRGGRGALAAEHRIGITATWRQLIAATGGVATTKAGSERSWEPVLGASLRVTRYELGVLREMLANDFGAAYSFRFRIGLK